MQIRGSVGADCPPCSAGRHANTDDHRAGFNPHRVRVSRMTCHARVIPDVTGRTLLPAIEEVMDAKRTWLTTDGGAGYKQIAAQFAAHEFVDHSAGEYVRGNVSTNLVEGWFSQLKRSIDGTHHHVSTTHLDRYLTLFAWLYTNCKASDSVRMHTLINNVAGRRLTYKPLAGQ